MPRIFDNINEKLQSALVNTLQTAQRADFCVGYFNLRGWHLIQPTIDHWTGEEQHQCRLLIGMQRMPQDQLRELFSLSGNGTELVDMQKIVRLRRQIAEDFRNQLMLGAPTNADEQGLRDLVRQLREGKLVVKLFLRHTLHAKLYLLHRQDYSTPIHAYLGSSNLTFSGLAHQGELNTEVTDYDACQKLAAWFEERWHDSRCYDITQELIAVIEESWARTEMLTPYEVYIKIAYHLAQEALAGLSGEFRLPAEFATLLFDYQAAAVQIAAHHLNKRGGVLLGDVVGLGKTLMATAIARIFQDDYLLETLIICPKNLVPMWQKYVTDYRLIARIVSLSRVAQELPKLPRCRLVIIDESHNLRNREGQRYAVIQEYLTKNESKCMLLSATPYNKSFLDLSAQLRLFIPEERDLGIRPERYLQEIGEVEFMRRHQALLRSLPAFEKSTHIDDWRDLMRLFLVRRTRSFILANAESDPVTGRRFLRLRDGSLSYFPVRLPKSVPFAVNDQYYQLYSTAVVDLINTLSLPRYGLGQYVSEKQAKAASSEEKRLLDNLSRAGERLMGFCRTNLFKRLESSGAAFLQSIDRHLLRNFVFLYAIESNLPLPIGAVNADLLDTYTEDEDVDSLLTTSASASAAEIDGDEDDQTYDDTFTAEAMLELTRGRYKQRAQQAYTLLTGKYQRRFKWLRPTLFTARLKKQLLQDADALLAVLQQCGAWQVDQDTKLLTLYNLITQVHPAEKVLIFSQFADTIRYLYENLSERGVTRIAAATGQSDDPTALAYRFSPISNQANITPDQEIRVLLSTDVLSEGQNLQDCAIVINFDLPWAIIRLSQRAGRVDRIGQRAEQIMCYSFLPADGVEQIIHLRARVRQRLDENGEVIGSDEQFFEDQALNQQLRDLYTEKSGIFDQEADTEVDLASYAYQIWANATKNQPALAKKIADLPDVVYSSRHYIGSLQRPQGVLVYMKSSDGADALAWVNEQGESVTQSYHAILQAAACPPDTPPQPRHPSHHELVGQAVELLRQEASSAGGQLGPVSSAKRRAYERLSRHLTHMKATMPLFVPQDLERAIDDLYRYPLRSTARDILNRQLRAGIDDADLANLVMSLRTEDRLSLIQEDQEQNEPRILCSLGLFSA